MTESQRNLIRHAILLAENADSELGSNSIDGDDAPPTIKQISRAVMRMKPIIVTLEAVL